MTVVSFPLPPELDAPRLSALMDLLYAAERESVIRLDKDHRRLFAAVGRLYSQARTVMDIHSHSMTADAATARCRCREHPSILVSFLNTCSDTLRLLETRPLGPLTEALQTLISDVTANVNEHGGQSILTWVGPTPGSR